jgi:hypothetical protein
LLSGNSGRKSSSRQLYCNSFHGLFDKYDAYTGRQLAQEILTTPIDHTARQRTQEFACLFDACKNSSERHLLNITIAEGVTFDEFTKGFSAPYNVMDLIMTDIAKTMRRPVRRS